MGMPEPNDPQGLYATVKDLTADSIWPPDDEDIAFQLAAVYHAAAAAVDTAAGELETTATSFSGAWTDEAGVKYQQAITPQAEYYRALANAMRGLGDGVHEYGQQVKEAKINVWVEIGVNAVLFGVLSLLPGGGFLAMGLARGVAGRLVSMISGMTGRVLSGGMTRAVNALTHLGVEVGKEAFDEAVVNASTQGISMLAGNRDQFDVGQLGKAAVTGAVGGVIGEPLGKVTAPVGAAANAAFKRVMPDGLAQNLSSGVGSAVNNAVTSPSASYIVENHNNLGALLDPGGYAKAIAENGAAAGLMGAPRSMTIDAVQQLNPGGQDIANNLGDRIAGNDGPIDDGPDDPPGGPPELAGDPSGAGQNGAGGAEAGGNATGEAGAGAGTGADGSAGAGSGADSAGAGADTGGAGADGNAGSGAGADGNTSTGTDAGDTGSGGGSGADAGPGTDSAGVDTGGGTGASTDGNAGTGTGANSNPGSGANADAGNGTNAGNDTGAQADAGNGTGADTTAGSDETGADASGGRSDGTGTDASGGPSGEAGTNAGDGTGNATDAGNGPGAHGSGTDTGAGNGTDPGSRGAGSGVGPGTDSNTGATSASGDAGSARSGSDAHSATPAGFAGVMGGAPTHTSSSAPPAQPAKVGQPTAANPAETDTLHDTATHTEGTQPTDAAQPNDAAELNGTQPSATQPSAAQPGGAQPNGNPQPGAVQPSGAQSAVGGASQSGVGAGPSVVVGGAVARVAAAARVAAPTASEPASPKPAPSHTKVGGPPPRGPVSQPDAAPMRPVSTTPTSLGGFSEDRLTRDGSGRITAIDGVGVNETLRRLARVRVEQYWNAQRVEDETRFDGPNAAQRPDSAFDSPSFQRPNPRLNYEVVADGRGRVRLQGRNLTGNTLALVIDVRTGEVFEAVNGTPGDVHPILRERAAGLDPAGYLQFDNDGSVLVDEDGNPGRKGRPYPPDLFSHAEVRAVNEGLHANPGAVPSDFVSDVQFLRGDGVKPAWFCMNCSCLLHDVATNAGKRVYSDHGPQAEPGHFNDDPEAPLHRPGDPVLDDQAGPDDHTGPDEQRPAGSARGAQAPAGTYPVRAVENSGFAADPNRTPDEFVVRTEARVAMSRVQDDVGVTVRNLGNGRFLVTRADGSRFAVRVMAGDTANGNPAEVVVRQGATPVIRIASRLGKAHIDRAVASALSQLSARLGGNAVGSDILTSEHHPGSRAERSAHDEGRQAEVRHLDRKLQQANLLRRSRLAAEMRALVEDMGVHPDAGGGKQRYAATAPETRSLLDKYSSRRPSWTTPLTGYPAWHSFRYHLAAEVAPGLAASSAIAATGATLPALGVALATLGTGIAGTFIKKRYGWHEKQLVDAGHAHFGEVRAHDTALRRKQLLDPLLQRTGAAGMDVGPAEPAPGTTPPAVQSYGQRLLYRGVPALVGAAAATALIPFGLPVWTAAAHWGVAGLAVTLGPLAERYLRAKVVPMEWARIDNSFRAADDTAARFDEAFVAELHRVLDRIEQLAGIAPTSPQVQGDPVQRTEVTDPGTHRFAANAAPGSLADVARGLADTGGKLDSIAGQSAEVVAQGMHAAADMASIGATRGLVGALIATFLDRNFTRAEYVKIIEQVDFDAHSTMAEQVRLQHDTLLTLLAEVNAQLDHAEAAQRIQSSAPSRAAHLAPPPTPGDPAQRPAGQQDLSAFRRLALKQAAAMETVAVTAAVLFQEGASWLAMPGLPVAMPVTGIVIGAVSAAVASSFGLRYLMRRAEQRAVDEKIFADRAKERLTEAVQAEERREFDAEFWTRRIDAAQNGHPLAEAPVPAPPKVPKPLDRRDAAYPDHVQAIATHEREKLLHDPRPWSLTDARLDGLRRINTLAERVRTFQQGTLSEPAQLEQAQLDLSNLLAAYQELVKNGTPLPEDDEVQSKKPGHARSGNQNTPKLSTKLRKIFDQSIETPGGRAFHDPGDTGIIGDALALPARPGMYTVDIHGHPDNVEFMGRKLTEHDLAALLRHDPNWDGQPIWLFSCETGQLDDGFAQRLADLLGVPVTAPTEIAVSDLDGDFFVATETGTDVYGDPVYTHPPDGHWRRFEPGGKTGTTIELPHTGTTGTGRNTTTPEVPRPTGSRFFPDREDVVLDVPEVDIGTAPVRPVHTTTARLWPDELADLITTDGRPVRITIDGTLSEDYLQRTADLLGVDVSVPPSVVTGGPANPSSGMLEVFTGEHTGGEWRTFRARVTSEGTP